MNVKKRAKKKAKKKPRITTAKAKAKPEREGYHLPVRTEAEQLEGLAPELVEAWRALKIYCTRLGEQRIHTSHRSVMFNRKTCYLFVRPKKSFLEVNFFLLRQVESELLHKVTAVSKTKYAHVMKVVHADQVEEPLTDWIHEAYSAAH